MAKETVLKHLVIVESPAKSKTIMKYLWAWFEVKASFGHISDLPKKNMWIDVENNFEPIYEVSKDKTKVVSELKKAAKIADKVWIATDEDREWEAIGWHVCNALNLDVSKTARIVFHEITKTAITHAVKNPRTIDMDLVDAQQARRILDRIVWFELSPVLWKKIKYWLSAGRVQSVAVRVIVEREREIQAFNSIANYKIVWDFENTNWDKFTANLNKTFIKKEDVHGLFELLNKSDFIIWDITTKPWQKSSAAPFTTSTLQQEASRKMWFPVARTMQVAQKLYEQWLITYMRTDSINISQTAVDMAESEVVSQYWQEYSKPTFYKWKTKWAQEAHECIRPTSFAKHIAGADLSQQKLYALIWKRTIASQMSPAKVEKTKVLIDFVVGTISWTVRKNKAHFVAEWEVIKFDWFLKVYVEWTDNEDDFETKDMLPVLKEWETLDYDKISGTETFKKHPPRYTEASLVKELEKKGIWRPSTYAPTISTIQKREYIIKENRDGELQKITEIILQKWKISEKVKNKKTWVEKQKLFPTDIWMVVNDFLIEHFDEIMNYDFTANVEEQFDIIAEWKLKRQKMIGDFYWPFDKKVNETVDKAERASGEKILGKDSKTWKTILGRIGRYGPMVQLGTPEEVWEEWKPKYASIPKWMSIETMSLEDAIKCFDMPRQLWEFDGKDITVAIGRFGPYVKWGSLFASIKKSEEFPNDDPYKIDLTRCIELIKQKIETDKNKYISEFEHKGEKIEVLNWRYGPYIKYKKKNYKLPKELKEEPKKIKKTTAVKIIEWKYEAKPSKKKVTKKKKTTNEK